jgi:uncharacterized tellurite resistance protein B-like protein
MDIFDIINEATKEADSFEGHPAAKFCLEEQLLYLNALALVMNADGHVDDSEKEYIRILIKSMELDESLLDDMVIFAKAPDKDTVQAFFRTFRRRPIAQLFLFDALMMTRRDGKVHEKETAVVNKIADQLEILKGTQRDIFDLFCHIRNRNWQESALYFSSHLLNSQYFMHLLSYYQVDFDELMTETSEIRAARLLQVIANKMSKITSDNFVKPILDHDVLLPMLQAEIDRGNANIINNIMTLKNNPDFCELMLDEEGLGWDRENLNLYSKKNQEIINENLIKHLIYFFDVFDVKDIVNALYQQKFKFSSGKVTAEGKALILNHNVTSESPYVELAEQYFKVIDNVDGPWVKNVLYTSECFHSGSDSINLLDKSTDNIFHILGSIKCIVTGSLEKLTIENVFETGLMISK